MGFFVGLGSSTVNVGEPLRHFHHCVVRIADPIAQLYGQDILPGQGGAVSASVSGRPELRGIGLTIQLNLVRCIFGAVGTAVIQLLYNAIGAGWTSVLLSALCIAASPLFLVIAKWGPKWREGRRRKRVEKDERRDGRQGRI